MTLPLARDLARYGIRVVSIAPAIFSTAMGSHIPARARANLVSNTVFPPRTGRAEECRFLVGEVASLIMLQLLILFWQFAKIPCSTDQPSDWMVLAGKLS
jgi:NAD(P)-dependent dehydrogenase (short-subunit alcohol dehydrogenase family)